MLYESNVKSLVSLNEAIFLRHVEAAHPVAIQQNVDLFNFMEKMAVSLVPYKQSSHSSSSP